MRSRIGERARRGRGFPRPRGKPRTDRKFRTPHPGHRASDGWTRGASSNARGGRAPNSDFGLKTILRPLQRLSQPVEIDPAAEISIFDREQSAENESPLPAERPVFAVLDKP